MLKLFIEMLSHSEDKKSDSKHTVEVATASLLFVVANSDNELDLEEIKAIEGSLREHLSLPEEEINAILQSAEFHADDAIDLIQFTQVIKQSCSAQEREQVIYKLWQVAMADQYIDKHEEAVIRKIADLLYVPHSVFVQAKLNAKGEL